MSIYFSKSAISDLEGIKAFYLEQGVPNIGLDFVAKIIEHIETLSAHPEIGRVVPEFDDKLIRELIHSPFRIVYIQESKTIQIIRIWRSERLLKLAYN